jgi:hypothetical protein
VSRKHTVKPTDGVRSDTPWSVARRLSPILLCALVLSCAPQIRQFYPDTFYAQDHTYENKSLGFALTFAGNWEITTNPKEMNAAGKKVARDLQSSGGELLFTGFSVEGTQGTRGIVENLNLSDEDYLKEIQKSNSASIEKDLGSISFQAGDRLVLKWQYVYAGLSYVEFLFKSGTYNVRIAFWTKPELYERFLPVYEDIIGSLSFFAGQRY